MGALEKVTEKLNLGLPARAAGLNEEEVTLDPLSFRRVLAAVRMRGYTGGGRCVEARVS